MSTPQLSVVPAEATASTMSQPATQHGTMQLHLPSGAHVHIHLGAAPAADVQPALGRRVSVVPLVLAGLALLGGGYLAGSRGPAARAGDDGSGAPASASLLPPAPDLPAAPGELPPALRTQLARPPVVTPPPGATGAPARNPFGLGN